VVNENALLKLVAIAKVLDDLGYYVLARSPVAVD